MPDGYETPIEKGSRLRCLKITQGTRAEVAERLTALIASYGTVSENDIWMPNGFTNINEAELDKNDLFDNKNLLCKALNEWWFSKESQGKKYRSPNWDIASSCTINNKKGLLLVEAKAHLTELKDAQAGKSDKNLSEKGKLNHDNIGSCIDEANENFSSKAFLSWHISRDSNYQISNRFAWSWKILDLEHPVILIYLGFLNATEMESNGKIFNDHKSWEDQFIDENNKISKIIPASVWNQKMIISNQNFIPILRSVEIPFEGPIKDFKVNK